MNPIRAVKLSALVVGVVIVTTFSAPQVTHASGGFFSSVANYFSSLFDGEIVIYRKVLPQPEQTVASVVESTDLSTQTQPDDAVAAEGMGGLGYYEPEDDAFVALRDDFESALDELEAQIETQPSESAVSVVSPVVSNEALTAGNFSVPTLSVTANDLTVALSGLNCSDEGGGGKLTTDRNGTLICADDRRGPLRPRGGSSSSGGGSITDTDDQTLSFNATTSILTIASGNSVDLSSLLSGSTSTLEDLADVASFAQSTGDLIYWDGSQWTNISTSSLNISATSPFGADINVTELASQDFGDFTCNGTTCSLDSSYIATTTGDWLGTFDGQEGSYYLDLANATGDTDDVSEGSTNLFSQWSTNGSDISYTTGGVGIGTTSPGQELVIDGDVQITGSLFDNSISAGLNGYLLQSDGAGFNWVATSTLGLDGTNLTIGTNDQIPYTNAGGDDYDYSSNLTFDGSVMTVGGTGISLSGSTANIALGTNYVSGDGGDEGIYINSDGEVGINTTNPQDGLEIFGGNLLISNTQTIRWRNNAATPQIMLAYDSSNNFQIGSGVSGSTLFFTNNRFDFTNGSDLIMRLDSNGDLGIGNEDPLVKLHVGSTTVTDSTNLIRLEDSNSTCNFNADSGGPTCGSDKRLKKDISTINDALDSILALEPSFYRWKTDSADSPLQSGFIAQEVEEVLPELVSDGIWIDGSEKKFLSTNGMIPYIVGAIKDMWAQVTDNEDEIDSLKARVAELEAMVGNEQPATASNSSREDKNDSTPEPTESAESDFKEQATATSSAEEAVEEDVSLTENVKEEESEDSLVSEENSDEPIEEVVAEEEAIEESEEEQPEAVEEIETVENTPVESE